jgi:hypothetical protein
MPELEILYVENGVLRYLRYPVIKTVYELQGWKIVSQLGNEEVGASRWGICRVDEKEPSEWTRFAEFKKVEEKYIAIILHGSLYQLRRAHENLTRMRNQGLIQSAAEEIVNQTTS